MEEEGTETNKEVADKGDREDFVMFVYMARVETAHSVVDEENICQGVKNLGSIRCRIVVLQKAWKSVLHS